MASFATIVMAEGISAKANATEQFTFAVTNLNPKTVISVDVPPAGLSVGDMRYLNGTLRSENETGPIIGELFTSNAVVGLMPGQRFMAMTYHVFTFKNKIDQIVAGGVTENPMIMNETATRAIRALISSSNNLMRSNQETQEILNLLKPVAKNGL